MNPRGLRPGPAPVRLPVPPPPTGPVRGPPRRHRMLRSRPVSRRTGPRDGHPPAVHHRRDLQVCGRGGTARPFPGVHVRRRRPAWITSPAPPAWTAMRSACSWSPPDSAPPRSTPQSTPAPPPNSTRPITTDCDRNARACWRKDGSFGAHTVASVTTIGSMQNWIFCAPGAGGLVCCGHCARVVSSEAGARGCAPETLSALSSMVVECRLCAVTGAPAASAAGRRRWRRRPGCRVVVVSGHEHVGPRGSRPRSRRRRRSRAVVATGPQLPASGGAVGDRGAYSFLALRGCRRAVSPWS